MPQNLHTDPAHSPCTSRLSLWGAWALLAMYFAYCWMSYLPFGDELQQFPRALHTLSPGWLVDDNFIGSPQGDHWVFFRFLGAFFWFAGPVGGAMLARIGLWCLMAAAILSLGRALRLRLPAILAGVALFVAYDQCRFGGETIVGEAIARHLAYPLVLFALSGWLRGQFLLAGGLLGAAISVHVLVGAWAAASIVILMFLDERARGRRWRFGPAFACLLFALPGLIPILPLIKASELSRSEQADNIFIYFRHPHHLHPGSWPMGDYLQFGLMFGAFLFITRWLQPSERLARLRQFVWLITMVTVIGIGIGLVLHDPFFLKLHPYRFAPPLTSLMVGLLLGELLFSLRARTLQWVGALLVGIAAMWFSPRGAYHLYKDMVSRPAMESDRIAALQWIKQHAPENSEVLTDPSWSDVQWHSRRASVVSFKLIPFEPLRIEEWYRRLTQIGSNPPWNRPGQVMLNWYSQAYNALGRGDLHRIARELDADLTVSRQPCDPIQLVHANEHYCIHVEGGRPRIPQNYIVVRYDDFSPISPYEGPPRKIDTERRLFELAKRLGGRVSVGVIPFPVSGLTPVRVPSELTVRDSWAAEEADPWLKLLRDAVDEGVVEPALHGLEHRRTTAAGHRPGEFRGRPRAWQLDSLRAGRDAIATALHKTVRVFVPPWNSWDAATISALEELDFEVLSPDQHHAEAGSQQVRFLPQCTADPAEALSVMQGAANPDGSVLVLVTHPFDFETKDGAGEVYFQRIEEVFRFAQDSSAWASVGFLDLPVESTSVWSERFKSVVDLYQGREMLADLHSPLRPSSTALIRPLHWYQDNLWRARLPLVCILAFPALVLALCSRWMAIRIGHSRLPASAGMVLAAGALLYLSVGAMQIIARGYAVRGLRWLAISLTAGALIGFVLAVFQRGTSRKLRGINSKTLVYERHDERTVVPV